MIYDDEFFKILPSDAKPGELADQYKLHKERQLVVYVPPKRPPVSNKKLELMAQVKIDDIKNQRNQKLVRQQI